MGMAKVMIFMQSHFLNVRERFVESREGDPPPNIFRNGLEFGGGNGP